MAKQKTKPGDLLTTTLRFNTSPPDIELTQSAADIVGRVMETRDGDPDEAIRILLLATAMVTSSITVNGFVMDERGVVVTDSKRSFLDFCNYFAETWPFSD